MRAEFSQASVSPLRQQVYDAIISNLLRGQLAPGARLPEAGIAKQMGVSQAPVREAMRQLEEQGVVISYPNRGAFVASLGEEDAREIYTLRMTLEALAIRLAVPNLTATDIATLASLSSQIDVAAQGHRSLAVTEEDLEFHRTIWRRSGHRRLCSILQGTQLQTMVAMAAINRLSSSLVGVAHSHQAIVDALERADAAAAAEAMCVHLQAAGDELVRMLRQARQDGEPYLS